MANRFTRGDYIQVTDKEGGMWVRGTALDTRGYSGDSVFDGRDMRFNLNQVTVENLFRADIAREK